MKQKTKWIVFIFFIKIFGTTAVVAATDEKATKSPSSLRSRRGKKARSITHTLITHTPTAHHHRSFPSPSITIRTPSTTFQLYLFMIIMLSYYPIQLELHHSFPSAFTTITKISTWIRSIAIKHIYFYLKIIKWLILI